MGTVNETGDVTPGRVPAWWVFLAALFPVAVTTVEALVGGGRPETVLTEASSSVIIWFPCVAWCAAVFGRFSAWHLAVPWALYAVMFLFGDPVVLLGLAIAEIAPKSNPGLTGKSFFVLSGVIACGMAGLGSLTIYRLVSFIVSAAQVATLVLFHVVLASWPFDGMETAEKVLVRDLVRAQGSFDHLCGTGGRICYSGTVDGALLWASEKEDISPRTLRTMEDTKSVDRMLFTWFEGPDAFDLGRVDLISILKVSGNEMQVMISGRSETFVYEKLRLGLGIIILLFTQSWAVMGSLIVWRHGDYLFNLRQWRWVRP